MGNAAERQLLLLVARMSTRERDVALRQVFGVQLNWERLFGLARAHGLLPLLAATAREVSASQLVAASAQNQLRLLCAATTLKSRVLFDALAEALDAMHSHGVQPLVLKGPALASTLYGEHALRPFSDLDLLCPPDQILAAGDALHRLDYIPRAQDTAEQEAFHIVYQRAHGGIVLELHSDLLQLGLRTRCATSLWRRAETFTFGEQQALMLGLEEQLLHLCVHLHTHGYTRLIWFKDIDLVVRQRGHEIDWDRLASLARSEGVTLSLRHALCLTHDLLGMPLPPDCLRPFHLDPLGELAHAVLWPHKRIIALESKQRVRSLRFNPRLGPVGIVPSLVVMGRRHEKLAALLRSPRRPHTQAQHAERLARSQTGCDPTATGYIDGMSTLATSSVAAANIRQREGR